MKNLTYLSLLPLLLAGCGNASKEANEPSETPSETVSEIPEGVSKQPCKSYAGQTVAPVSFDGVYELLSRAAVPKDEFETTAQHEARVAEAVGGLSYAYIINVPLNNFDLATIKYDADRQKLIIISDTIDSIMDEYAVDWSSVFGVTSKLHEKVEYGYLHRYNIDLVVSSEGGIVGKHTARNAFGVSVEVTEMEENVKAVFDRKARGIYSYQPESLFFPSHGRTKKRDKSIAEIAADPSSARVLRSQLKAAVVVAPKSPWAGSGTDYSEATIDSPVERKSNITAIIADIQCMLITDGDSKVLAAVPTR